MNCLPDCTLEPPGHIITSRRHNLSSFKLLLCTGYHRPSFNATKDANANNTCRGTVYYLLGCTLKPPARIKTSRRHSSRLPTSCFQQDITAQASMPKQRHGCRPGLQGQCTLLSGLHSRASSPYHDKQAPPVGRFSTSCFHKKITTQGPKPQQRRKWGKMCRHSVYYSPGCTPEPPAHITTNNRHLGSLSTSCFERYLTAQAGKPQQKRKCGQHIQGPWYWVAP